MSELKYKFREAIKGFDDLPWNAAAPEQGTKLVTSQHKVTLSGYYSNIFPVGVYKTIALW